jgi:GNAT superfamily N-acetyltransferase
MLYEAAYWRGGHRPDFEVGLSTPEHSKLLADWGRDGDTAVVAENGSKPVGVAERYRNMGIGRWLVEQLFADSAHAGTEQVSLSVEQDNPALYLYKAMGFKIVGTVGNVYTMVANILHWRY